LDALPLSIGRIDQLSDLRKDSLLGNLKLRINLKLNFYHQFILFIHKIIILIKDAVGIGNSIFPFSIKSWNTGAGRIALCVTTFAPWILMVRSFVGAFRNDRRKFGLEFMLNSWVLTSLPALLMPRHHKTH
jgi:hypothetical protein